MFLIIVAVVVSAVVLVMLFGRNGNRVVREARIVLVDNAIGVKGVLEDIMMKNNNVFDVPTRKGCTAVVTGGARGIGVEIVRMLASAGIRTIIGCRTVSVGEELARRIRKDYADSEVIVYELDVSSFDSIKSFANKVTAEHPKVNYLINNAGFMFGPYKETVDGFEWQFGVNYLGHYLLSHLLMPNLVAAGRESDLNSRIVNVSSIMHIAGEINFDDINTREPYVPSVAYAQSKFAQVLFTFHLDRTLRNGGVPVQVHAVHPGIVDTGLFDTTWLKKIAPWFVTLFFKTPVQGAMSIVYACLSPDLEGKGGNYISNCVVTGACSAAEDRAVQEKLFSFTNNLIGVKDFGEF